MNGVARELGLSAGLQSAALVAAGDRWSGWRRAEPILNGRVELAALEGLPGWLRSVEPARADEVLRVLTRIASPTGENDRAAVDVVAWALLPGARALARRLQRSVSQVDALVAGQLWIEIRNFPWERLGRVAGNVLANTRARVLADATVQARADNGRSGLVLVDPHSPFWARLAARDQQSDSAVELGQVLSAAVDCGSLTVKDRVLLLTLLEQAEEVGVPGACRARGGLLAGSVVHRVAAATGWSPATIRRRVRRSTQAIADAHRSGGSEAA